MKIALASKGDPRSALTWSSIPYHVLHYLERRGHNVYSINLHSEPEPWYYKWARSYYHRIHKKGFLSDVEPYVLKKIAKRFDAEVNELQPDVVIVFHADYLSFTTFDTPTIIIHDATFASLLNYYSHFSNLARRSIVNGNRMYQLALDKCASILLSSGWASESAYNDYEVDPKKIITAPLGANLSIAPKDSEIDEQINEKIKNDQLSFLFLGTDWQRKGWDDALAFVKILNGRGVKCKLTAVGCLPNVAQSDQEYVSIKGFYNRSIPEENLLLENMFKESHALLLPSLAECYGCVYCEANAYGLPALGRDTGGISEIIKENRNGILLGKQESLEKFADRWLDIWSNKNAYQSMCYTARNEFKERLNYDIFIDRIEQLLPIIA